MTLFDTATAVLPGNYSDYDRKTLCLPFYKSHSFL